jgi:hypothetical protein
MITLFRNKVLLKKRSASPGHCNLTKYYAQQYKEVTRYLLIELVVGAYLPHRVHLTPSLLKTSS